MDELIDVMQSILLELQEMNGKLESIMGFGVWNSISDVYDKLGEVESAISSLEATVQFK